MKHHVVKLTVTMDGQHLTGRYQTR